MSKLTMDPLVCLTIIHILRGKQESHVQWALDRWPSNSTAKNNWHNPQKLSVQDILEDMEEL